jgi:hypothetical protein
MTTTPIETAVRMRVKVDEHVTEMLEGSSEETESATAERLVTGNGLGQIGLTRERIVARPISGILAARLPVLTLTLLTATTTREQEKGTTSGDGTVPPYGEWSDLMCKE